MPEVVSRSVWIHEVSAPALVLGSSQRPDIVDDATIRSIEVARRRSGGGAVLLIPGEVVWLDVLIPTGDPLWSDDVSHASHWLGDVWVAALGYGEVHRGPMVRTQWSSLVCFAGLGPGEVTVDGRKLVGISQRRTRAGARFQCAVYACHDPSALPGLLRLSPSERAECAAALAPVATVPSASDLLSRLLEALPT
jgi:lipoate---protein ligase